MKNYIWHNPFTWLLFPLLYFQFRKPQIFSLHFTRQPFIARQPLISVCRSSPASHRYRSVIRRSPAIDIVDCRLFGGYWYQFIYDSLLISIYSWLYYWYQFIHDSTLSSSVLYLLLLLIWGIFLLLLQLLLFVSEQFDEY